MNKLSYTHIIAVPASQATTKPELMTDLAIQMSYLKGKRVTIVTLQVGYESEVILTAGGLNWTLSTLGFDVRTIISSFNSVPSSTNGTDEETLEMIKQAMAEAATEVLIIVTSEGYATRIPRLVLTYILEAQGIRADIDMVLMPGEAGIVDCRTQTRNCLRPQERWAQPKRAVSQ